jgi:hypothetical protein
MAMNLASLRQAIDGLQAAIAEAPNTFRRITDSQAEAPRGPGRWSRKQVLGHLIDSAANNHQRFVRMQLRGGLDLPTYDQEGWVAVQHYQRRAWSDLIELWTLYNRHLLHIVRRVPAEALSAQGTMGGQDVTLEFIIVDYLDHLKHHLAQIAEPL